MTFLIIIFEKICICQKSKQLDQEVSQEGWTFLHSKILLLMRQNREDQNQNIDENQGDDHREGNRKC